MTYIKPGTRFIHYKHHDIYEVVLNGYLETDETEMVVYKKIATGKIWIRPLQEFFDMITLDDNSKILRYTPLC
jgi:hypothetical protein